MPQSEFAFIEEVNQLQLFILFQVIILDSIPLLVNGKNDRQSLLKMYENTNNNGKNKYSFKFISSLVSSTNLFMKTFNIALNTEIKKYKIQYRQIRYFKRLELYVK